jgi:hypothetical protein
VVSNTGDKGDLDYPSTWIFFFFLLGHMPHSLCLYLSRTFVMNILRHDDTFLARPEVASTRFALFATTQPGRPCLDNTVLAAGSILSVCRYNVGFARVAYIDVVGRLGTTSMDYDNGRLATRNGRALVVLMTKRARVRTTDVGICCSTTGERNLREGGERKGI